MTMNTKINFILALALITNLNLLAAQSNPQDLIRSMAPANWEKSENWVYDFRNNLGSQASLAWINDVLSEGADMYWNQNHQGLIIIGTEENEDDLTAEEFSQTNSLGDNQTALVPTGETQAIEYGAVTEWRGNIEGQQVVMQRICLYAPANDEFLTITSIVPLENHMESGNPTLDTGFSIASRMAQENDSLVSRLD